MPGEEGDGLDYGDVPRIQSVNALLPIEEKKTGTKVPSPRITKRKSLLSLIDRQNTYKRPLTSSSIHYDASKWWKPISLKEVDVNNPFIQAIKKGVDQPSSEINLRGLNKSRTLGAIKFGMNQQDRYESSEFGVIQKRASEIKFHCSSIPALGEEGCTQPAFSCAQRTNYFDKHYTDGLKIPGPVDYDNYWRRLGSMISDHDLMRFSENRVPTELEILQKRSAKVPGPGAYEIKKVSPRSGYFNKSKKPWTEIDWIRYRAKQIPSVHDYAVPPSPMPGGGRIAKTKRVTYLSQIIEKESKLPGPHEVGALPTNDPRLKLPGGGVISASDFDTWLDERSKHGRRLPGAADYETTVTALRSTGATSWKPAFADAKPDARKLSELNQYVKVKEQIPEAGMYNPASLPEGSSVAISTARKKSWLDRKRTKGTFMPNYSSLNDKSLVQYAKTPGGGGKKTSRPVNQPFPLRPHSSMYKQAHRVSPGPGDYLHGSSIDNLYSPLSTVINRAPKSQNYFEEIAKRTSSNPGPGRYNFPETLGKSKSTKSKAASRKKKGSKRRDKRLQKKEPAPATKLTKKKKSGPPMSFSVKSEFIPPFVICLTFRKQSFSELERKVRRKVQSALSDLMEGFEDYCLCDTSGMPLQFMKSAKSIRWKIPEDRLHPEKDLGLTNNQNLLFVRKTDAVCRWMEGTMRLEYLTKMSRGNTRYQEKIAAY